jgi:hypothetical protein
MRNLTELNINDGGRPVARNAPTDRVLAKFEKEFGQPLPEALRKLLSFANGGHPELNSIDGVFGQYAVNYFYHLCEEDHGTESLWYSMKHWRSVLGREAIPFANDGGGNQFFLDMSKDSAPVKICLHDKGFKILEIAGSLEEFIDRLQTDPDII